MYFCFFEFMYTIFYTGFRANAGNFFLFMLAVFAQNAAFAGIVYLIAAAIGVFASAQTLMNVIFVFAMVC